MIQNRVTMCQEIVKVQGEAIKRAEDELLLEHALSLEYGGEKISFSCTELLLRELAVGYVFSAFGRNLGKKRNESISNATTKHGYILMIGVKNSPIFK